MKCTVNTETSVNCATLCFDITNFKFVATLVQNECMHILPVKMGVPIVGFWMTAPLGFIMEQTMQPSVPSYVPMYMTGFSDQMSFFQRIQNFIWKFFTKIIGDFHIKGMVWYL